MEDNFNMGREQADVRRRRQGDVRLKFALRRGVRKYLAPIKKGRV